MTGAGRRHLIAQAAALVLAAFVVLAAGAHAGGSGGGKGGDAAAKPWAAAEQIRSSLFDARSELLLDGSSSERAASAARAALGGRAAPGPYRATRAGMSPPPSGPYPCGD